jgi:hypothetical protein
MWTDEMDVYLREWTREGVSAAKQAKRLGVSRNAVLGRRFRLGLKCGEIMRRQLCSEAAFVRFKGQPSARIQQLKSMSLGDSILVPKKEYMLWKKAEKQGGFIVLTRKAENDQIRIWRVA